MHALLVVGIPVVAVGLELALAIVVGRALKYGLGNYSGPQPRAASRVRAE